MDREEFGALIAALRENLGLTQAQLAAAAEELTPAISNIERGLRKHFEPDLLFRLAIALQLTMFERREFFRAASSLEEGNSLHVEGGSDFDAAKTVDRLVDLVGNIQLPTFLTDVFSDIIAMNGAFLTLFQLRPEQLEELAAIPGGPNSIHMIYGIDMPVRKIVSAKWEEMSLAGMQLFRQASLRFRATSYFKYLMVQFRNPRLHPGFERQWRLSSMLGEDNSIPVSGFKYHHVEYGWLSYYVSRLAAPTPRGELFLRQYLPTDEPTARVFFQLVQREGGKAYRWASWPEKTMI